MWTLDPKTISWRKKGEKQNAGKCHKRRETATISKARQTKGKLLEQGGRIQAKKAKSEGRSRGAEEETDEKDCQKKRTRIRHRSLRGALMRQEPEGRMRARTASEGADKGLS